MSEERREQIKQFVEREFIGPDPIEWDGLTQENGEEILVSDPPRTRYIAGILFPHGSRQDDNFEDEKETVYEQEWQVAEDGDLHGTDYSSGDEYEVLEDAEELIDRSNAFYQSAMSITVAIKDEDSISILVKAGTYSKSTETDLKSGKTTTKYYRIPLEWKNEEKINLPNKAAPFLKYPVGDSGLQVDITLRYRKEDFSIYTFSLENTKEMKGEQIRDEDCFFQVNLRILSEKGFHYLPESQRINADEDYMSNLLLYREVKNYAIGHGCAAEWEENKGIVEWIETAVFPSYEVKPIVPSVIDGVNLSMLDMSQEDNFKVVISQLNLLCDKYKKWIDELEKKEIPDHMKETAERHISNCRMCQMRMKKGVQLLASDMNVKKAFQWMNEAMISQQLHYGLPLQTWIEDGDGIKLKNPIDILPKLEDDSTWYKKDERVYGQWRPFQIAFILMNLDSMNNRKSKERKIVDLIWFPTGGGKTEAYLGLSAYTIFIRRLHNRDNAGTAILMRYTLRLLTAQQYERAAAVICACELIRQRNVEILGEEEISIGLWVGGDTTPNHVKDAVSKYNDIKNHRTDNNPFVMLKCPWCGAQMGIVDASGGKIRYLPGYKILEGARKSKKFIFKCANEGNGCEYAFNKSGLPLYIIDDDIYEKKPTLVLGTVDKFAMLPYRPEAQGLFGYSNGEKVSSPDLIIQDELHLISGPLGSMVGHYETMINDLCTENMPSGNISPKIIASTATISRAKEQCHALYGCGTENVFQFPPAGLDAGDSFFAKEDKEQDGRKYVGILAAGSPSDATTAIRLYSTLLYAAKTMEVEAEKDRDPYWTNVGYYNSIRELGQAQTWIKADIDQYLDVMYKRRYDDKRFNSEEYKKYRRYIYRDEELTSRIPGDKVTTSLAKLNIGYPEKRDADGKIKERALDICLATNMISVGLDVQRLGLMTVSGQPKTTSEYIQATSRVGRNTSFAPGLVFVLYRPSRPRDKSFYEQFKHYHSKLYCFVEPTSVTPFSAPVRSRALHAIMVGMMRLEHGKDFNEDPPRFPKQEIIDHIQTVIENRIKEIDIAELDDTMNLFNYRMQEWEDWNPQKWTPQKNYDMSMGNPVPLIYSSSDKPNVIWNGRGLPTPTSMRSVDASCEAAVLRNRYMERDE